MDVNRVVSRPRRIRHVGVAALARQLGLSTPHVSQVLSGQRQSRKVLEAARTSGLVVAVERGRPSIAWPFIVPETTEART